ncbi:LysM domain-containing protein [Agromyces neolithicus]|uniref:LysM peptidoglycan-binding domain-containing protein n=1 Tax=Agromyces neolithicus TaxID=269420 RepID=UPI0031D3C2D8
MAPDPALPEQAPRLSDLAPGTLIATGAFDDRGTTGRIEIRANGAASGFDVTLAGISPAPAAGMTLELNSLPPDSSDAELKSGFSYYRYDSLAQVSDQTFRVPSPGYGGFESNDPSYMRTAVIWAPAAGSDFGFDNVVSTAPLTWDLPDMNPGLEVVDHGAADGAAGQATLAADGAPIGYRVARGDTSAGIMARFGITMEDLEWLNPDRDRNRLVLADITLNLAPGSRGLRM